MHFRNQAEAKRKDLSSPQAKVALEFICRYFSNRIDNIINSSTTEKLGENCYLHTVRSKFDPRATNVRVVFTLDPNTGYQIDNFDFMGVFDWLAQVPTKTNLSGV